MTIIIMLYIYDFIHETDDAEMFDEKVAKSTSEQCGVMCTKILDCAGFSANNNTKKIPKH